VRFILSYVSFISKSTSENCIEFRWSLTKLQSKISWLLFYGPWCTWPKQWWNCPSPAPGGWSTTPLLDVMFSPHIPNGGVSLPQQPLTAASCTFLLHGIGCVLSQTTPGTNGRQVLTSPNFNAYYLWPWLSAPLTTLRYVLYFRFYGWRHIW